MGIYAITGARSKFCNITAHQKLEAENATLRAQLVKAEKMREQWETDCHAYRAQLAEAQKDIEGLVIDVEVQGAVSEDLHEKLTTLEQIAQGLADAVKTLHAMWGQSDTGLAALAKLDAYQQQKGT
jgi:chromosome segregation ATPase